MKDTSLFTPETFWPLNIHVCQRLPKSYTSLQMNWYLNGYLILIQTLFLVCCFHLTDFKAMNGRRAILCRYSPCFRTSQSTYTYCLYSVSDKENSPYLLIMGNLIPMFLFQPLPVIINGALQAKNQLSHRIETLLFWEGFLLLKW